MTFRLGAKRIGDGESLSCSCAEDAEGSFARRHPEPPPGVTGESFRDAVAVHARVSADTEAVIEPDRLREGIAAYGRLVGGTNSLMDKSSAEGESGTEPPQGRIMARTGVDVGVTARSSGLTVGVDAEAQAEDGCAIVEVELPLCRLETPRRLDTRRNALEAEVTVVERLRDARSGVDPETLGGLGTVGRESEPAARVRITGEAGGVLAATGLATAETRDGTP